MSDAAFDASAQALARRILRDLPADRPRTRADLDRVPVPVARLLHARLDAQAEHAAPFPASPWVDAESDGVREATRTWRDAVREAARVPADVWAPAVEQAARLALSHLVWPAETLAAYAFEGEAGPISPAVALGRIRAFGPYPYLPEIAGRYVEAKGLERIDRAGLERLLRRIDRRMVSAFGVDEWMTLLGPLVDLLGPVGTPPGTVPTDLLRPLFEATDAHALASEVAGPSALSAEELRARVAAVLAPTAPETPVAGVPADEAPVEAPAEPDGPAETPEPPPPATVTPIPPFEAGPEIAAREAEPELNEADPVPEAAGPLPLVPDLTPEAEGLEAVPTDPEAGAWGPAGRLDAPDLPNAAHAPEPAPEAARPGPFWPTPPPAPEEEPPPPPPVIGSRYNDPADAPVYDSDVLGSARAVDDAPEAGPEAGPEVEPEAGDALDPEPEPTSIIFSHLDVGAPPADRTPTGFSATAPLDAPHLPEPPEMETSGPPLPEPGLDADDEPLWMRLAREREALGAPPPTADEDDEAPLWMRYVQPGGPETSGAPLDPPLASTPLPLDALERNVLGASEADERRGWFVDELFAGSEDDYSQTLAALDACRSYTEATQVVERDVFRAHRVNPYTDASVAFIDALQAQFTARGRG